MAFEKVRLTCSARLLAALSTGQCCVASAKRTLSSGAVMSLMAGRELATKTTSHLQVSHNGIKNGPGLRVWQKYERHAGFLFFVFCSGGEMSITTDATRVLTRGECAWLRTKIISASYAIQMLTVGS